LDTWLRGTKQSQTKPISTKKPLPAQRKTSLTSCLTMNYANTPQSQKQSQTNPISPPATKKLLHDPKQKHKKHRADTSQAPDTLTRSTLTIGGPMHHHVFRTKGYDTASGAAERVCKYMARSRLKRSAIIRTRARSSAKPPLTLCRLSNSRRETSLQNHGPHENSTYNPDRHPQAVGPIELFC